MVTRFNLDALSLEELKTLSKDIEEAIRRTETENLKKAREAAETAVRQFGLSLDEVTGRGSSPRSTPQSQGRYRNPSDVNQTWSGRGRQPQWFKDAIAGGKSREDLAA